MLQDSFKKGELSAQQIVKHYFKQIELYEPEVGAFISLCKESAFERAQALDEKRKNGQHLGKLSAVPVAIKDNINVKGTYTTCGSKFLTNYTSPYNATVVDLLEAEDAIIIGKTNMDEFAMGSSTENSALKQTRNPWNLNCSPGGSSGGLRLVLQLGLHLLLLEAIQADLSGNQRHFAELLDTNQPTVECLVMVLLPSAHH